MLFRAVRSMKQQTAFMELRMDQYVKEWSQDADNVVISFSAEEYWTYCFEVRQAFATRSGFHSFLQGISTCNIELDVCGAPTFAFRLFRVSWVPRRPPSSPDTELSYSWKDGHFPRPWIGRGFTYGGDAVDLALLVITTKWDVVGEEKARREAQALRDKDEEQNGWWDESPECTFHDTTSSLVDYERGHDDNFDGESGGWGANNDWKTDECTQDEGWIRWHDLNSGITQSPKQPGWEVARPSVS
ncbi:hypothetical protein M427DRAFT_130034 [Gonapodya prolifera JEL478]|uniref:Uncharacterized protein n=1 Tax=Gonapodya prolifera (strain JEL478) TaxID=1344416 RepID=A0A139B029_GONPJ|nr:hypothetical protein M427DRAFT_130034 [Gonapodya prolifera JEL478]|eukprot:KXS22324.1 hypothetical protein M427DRAFT_130034 [Gonapodya prolifera JEL478]